MNLPRWCVHLVSSAVACWQESAENPAVFCYLMGWGTFEALRSRERVPVNSARLETSCSNPSFTFSARSTTPTASEN
jgi:hypothetical protein